ncbi:uncharacterized protein [Antedon mediterranea]|uniref:uncharacterized protein n=1 Tax=Antedon mediterranea TaxID=105859 RepID=UPI003AF4E617
MAPINTLVIVILVIGVSKTFSSESLQLQLLEKHQTLLINLQNDYDILMQRQVDMKKVIAEVVRANTKLQLINEELEGKLTNIETFLRESTQHEGSSFAEDSGNIAAELVGKYKGNRDDPEECKERLDAVQTILLDDKQNAINELTNILESYEVYFKRVCSSPALKYLKKIPSLSEFIGNREEEIIEYKRNSADKRKEDASSNYDSKLSSFSKLDGDVKTLESRLDALETNSKSTDDLPGPKLKEKQNGIISGNSVTGNSVFSAARTNVLNGENYEQTVTFDQVITNLGGNLNSNSTFVAPVAGYYFFSFTLRTQDDKFLAVQLMQNGDHKTAIYSEKSDRNVMESQSIVLELAMGDRVWLRLGPSLQYGIYSDGFCYCTFNGFILSEINNGSF